MRVLSETAASRVLETAFQQNYNSRVTGSIEGCKTAMHRFKLSSLAGVVILLASIVGAGIAISSRPVQQTMQSSYPYGVIEPPANSVRIMPLGDSITQANARHNSYRRPLWLKLSQAGHRVDFVGSTRKHLGGPPPKQDFDLDHEGHWGWRVDEVLQQIEAWSRKAQPEIVLVHLGTNDLASGEPTDAVVGEVRSLIQTLRQVNPRVKVLVAELIPLEGSDPQFQQFNAQVRQLAAEMTAPESPVIAVDQFTGFDVKQDTYDGCHPNESGEKKMADRWFTALTKVLPQPQTTQ